MFAAIFRNDTHVICVIIDEHASKAQMAFLQASYARLQGLAGCLSFPFASQNYPQMAERLGQLAQQM